MKMGAKVQKLLEVKDKVAQTVRASLGGRVITKLPDAALMTTADGQDDPDDGLGVSRASR